MGSRPNSQRDRNRGMRSPYKTVTGSGRSSSSNMAEVRQNLERKAAETYEKYAKDNSGRLVQDTKIERNFNNTVQTLRNDYKNIKQGAAELFGNTSTNKNKSYSYSYSSASGYSEAGQFARQLHNGPVGPLSITEYAKNAAKADSATDNSIYTFYNRRRLNQKYHDDVIEKGNAWMTDATHEYSNWIQSAPTMEEAERRIEAAEEYFDKALNEVKTYDPSTGEYGTQLQFRADASLPPWVSPTDENLNTWTYYTTYSHDVVQSAAQAYYDAREEKRKLAKNPYKSAFSNMEETGQVDSFLDILITSWDKNSIANSSKNVIENSKTYFRDYIWNTIRTGHLKTAAGNALWNVMDTMDVASRGLRAFAAGKRELGGMRENGHTFEGQDEFWIKLDGVSDEDSRKAQELFLKSVGGKEALRAMIKNRNTGEKISLDNINRAFAVNPQLSAQGITAEQVRDAILDQFYFAGSGGFLKRGWENVKKTYSDVDATYSADTGNLAGDIVLETVLDPGMLVGGLAKGVVKGGVRSAAENGVEAGFRSILHDADNLNALLKNKEVRNATKALINSNEGKNIIFKDFKRFDDDIEVFINRVGKSSPIFSTETARKDFKRAVTAHLMGKQTSVNGAIIGSQDFARKAIDSKIFKAAYHADKAIDGIDSLIVKSSFFLPWAGVKGSKAGFHAVQNSDVYAKVAARLKLRKINAANVIVDDMTKRVNVTKLSDLIDQAELGMHRENDVRYALRQVVDQYDDVAWNVNDVIRKFSRGDITDEDALRLVGQHISDITGGKYKTVDDLAGYVDNIAPRYAGDIKSAFGRVDDSVRRLKDLIDRRSENAVEGFLDKVRQAKDVDELGRLFRENMDNAYIMALRKEVADVAQFKISTEEIDDLVEQVRSGLFSNESIDKNIIKKGVKAQAKLSSKSLRRTISFSQFEAILADSNFNWRSVVEQTVSEGVAAGTVKIDSVSYKLAGLMYEWSDNVNITYNIDDMLKFVDRLERSIHLNQLMNPHTVSEMSALDAHKLVGMCNTIRKQIKKIDIISLKDVKVITLPSMDRMAMNLEFRNSADIQKLYGRFFEDVIAPIWSELKKAVTDDAELMESSLFQDVDELARQKYGFDRTSQLIEQAKTLPGFSDDHLHSFINTLATDFRFHDELDNIDLAPGMLRRKVEATLRAQTGESKLGMKNITDALQSANSDNPSGFIEKYMNEFDEVSGLRERYNRYVEKDVLDPTAYVEKQMLFTALADPSVIPEWNALAKKGQAPIAMHINTTGLNTEINSITSVSFRKWKPIEITEDNPLTLERLLDALDDGETTVIQRRMTDAEMGELTEQVIRSLDMKDCRPDSIMNRYKTFYGVTDNAPHKSETAMLEEVCAYLSDASIIADNGLRSVSPTLLVHDLDGFNIDYLNNKVASSALVSNEETRTYDYLTRVSRSAKDNSCNTYTRLAEQVGDLYYTDEQLELITDLLHDYVDDINHFANGYKFNDMQTYSRKLHSMIDSLELKKNAGELTDRESDFLNRFNNAGGSELLANHDISVRNITSLGLYPKQYAFVSSGLEKNFTKAALDATGRTAVNTNNKIYVDNVLSYFDLETADGIYAPIEDLRKMNEVAKYIINKRDRQIVSGAEEMLLGYKEGFDNVIQSVKNLANSNSYVATKLSYLQNMKISDNAIDSYLMAKKLYNDHLKYWLDSDSLTSLRTEGKDLDAAKQKLYKEGRKLGKESPKYLLDEQQVFNQACDYINDNRVRFFDELVGGGFDNEAINTIAMSEGVESAVEQLRNSEDILDLLQGAREPEIFNWAARSDYEKRVLTYKDGVMKSGLEKATRYKEANSQIISQMRQLQHMDDYYTVAGITKRQDRFTASVYTKTKQLFDTLDQTGFLKRESFHDFMRKASDMHRLHLQQYRLNSLRNADGVFDRTRLLSELAYNGFNMTVFNSHNYTLPEMKELKEFVEGLQKNGDDFLSYYEDRTTGNIFIYLNNNCKVAEGDSVRWINNIRLERPVHEIVPHADFDELVKVLDIDDIEDYRDVYSHLLSCWEDTRLLSSGQINGTTGRTVSFKQSESFLQSLPSNMNDWLTSEGLLRDELTRGVIYDPGFVINEESDMLTDFLGTLHRQAETAKDDCILINEVFHSSGSVKFNELAENFDTKELIEYFGENPEYVVCTIVGDENTATGLKVQRFNLSNKAGVEAAKNAPNTTILPYSTYYEIANYMNRDVSDNIYKQLLGKYMLVYKAFALVKPGTWMRNFIDATLKAGMDNREGVGGIVNMLSYEMKAAKDIGTYGKILASDPALLTPANWDIIQKTFKTDMTFEDFELMRGVMDADRFTTADKFYLSRTARQRQGMNVISGENIGLRNLEEKDISEAFEKYLAKEPDLPLSKKEFLDIYTGKVTPDGALNEQYEEMFRKLSNNLRNGKAPDIFNKVVDGMFKPFGQVEELVRYAQTMQLRDSGFSTNQITRHIHDTQFYTAPTWGAWHKLEAIVPFITFKFNNMMYWVRMMDENPRFFRYFSDTYRSVYETTLESALQEGVELDYEDDYGLQSGGIPIGNGKRYFNIGSSFLSAMNDFYGLPHDIDSLNPLIRDTVRASLYTLGLQSKQFFSTLDLDMSDEDAFQNAAKFIPGYNLARSASRVFKNIAGASTEDGGPTMETLYSTLNFLGVLGIRYQYREKSGRFSMDEYQEELARQGKWYDANLGKVVDISQKNEYGANDPNNSFRDVQTYMLVHFGKVWDANQRKFVTMDKYQAGGLNDGFDFENDPDAWKKLCDYMRTQGKVWDYNQAKFVYWEDYQSGGLNRDRNTMEWDTVVALMEEKFPNLKWDANQQTFVDKRYYIAGGLNDVSEGRAGFREVMGLREALYGETYDKNAHKFIQTKEPQIVTLNALMDIDLKHKYEDYYTLLAIPHISDINKKIHVNGEGLLVTEDGKYILTGNLKYDDKVFAKFRNTYAYSGRSYSRFKRFSYNKTRKSKKPYYGRIINPSYYQTGYGWNEELGYYRRSMTYEYQYQYRSLQPISRTHRLISPPRTKAYPYGGMYGKFSFQSRY